MVFPRCEKLNSFSPGFSSSVSENAPFASRLIFSPLSSTSSLGSDAPLKVTVWSEVSKVFFCGLLIYSSFRINSSATFPLSKYSSSFSVLFLLLTRLVSEWKMLPSKESSSFASMSC